MSCNICSAQSSIDGQTQPPLGNWGVTHDPLQRQESSPMGAGLAPSKERIHLNQCLKFSSHMLANNCLVSTYAVKHNMRSALIGFRREMRPPWRVICQTFVLGVQLEEEGPTKVPEVQACLGRGHLSPWLFQPHLINELHLLSSVAFHLMCSNHE